MSAWSVYTRSLRILWAERALTIAIVSAGIGTAIVALFEPILFGRVIDALTKMENAVTTLSVWAAMGLLNVVVSVFLAVTADRLAHRQRLSVMGDVFDRTIALPMSYHAQHGSGRLVRSILSGTDQLFSLWLSFLREQLPSLVGIVLLIPMALKLNWKLAFLLFILAGVYLAGIWLVLKRTQVKQADVEVYHQDVFGRVGDVIGNVTVVQSYVRLVDESKALHQIMARLLSAQYPVLTWWGILNVITRVSGTLTLVAILGFGSWLSLHGEITVGEVVAFTGFSGLLIGRLDQISSFLSRTFMQTPTLKTFFELYDKQLGVQESPNARHLPGVPLTIRFENVSYRYPGTNSGIFHLQFEAPAGRTVALVGPSGSGKTTTLTLLQRLYDPDEGRITLNGEDIREFSMSSLRHCIATVFQDAGLFNRSIAENIRVGRPSATDQEIEEAARKAEAHDFITAKPEGYQFVIGERGYLLSGGERQRIAIARAILKDAPILIFDEATSALDTETEMKIQTAIQNARQDKTCFIIAHRLSTVVSADLILVFETGRIVQTGSFQELRTAGGLFGRLLKAGELAHDRGPYEYGREI